MIIDEKHRFWLTDEEVEKLRSYFPTPRGKRRVDDKRVLSGIIFVQRTGCRWRDAPEVYGPHKTLYTRWRRWSKAFWFVEMLQKMSDENKELVEEDGEIGNISMDATYCKAHRTACSMVAHTGELGRLIDRTKGGKNTKLHAVCDGKLRIFDIHLTDGSASDYKGAEVLIRRLPKWGRRLLADKGYDGGQVRKDTRSKGLTPCIPGRKNRVKTIRYNKKLYKQRNKIERAFGRIKDWRRVATRYDRCPEMFLSACALAAIVKFWL